MKFCYSKCYPDKGEIEFYRDEIDAAHVIDLFNTFGWSSELEKEIKFYSPSLEINRLNDKAKLIISGIGNGRLEKFIIMFFVPDSTFIEDVFNPASYKNAKLFESEFVPTKTFELLTLFLEGCVKEIEEEFVINKSININYRELSFVEKLICRIGGSLLALLMFYILILMIRDGVTGWPLVIVGGLFLIFVVGSIKFEMNLRNDKSS